MLKDQFFKQSTESGVAALEEEFGARAEAASAITALHFKACALASLLALAAEEGPVGKSRCGIFF